MTELRKRSRPFGVVVVDGSTADTPDAINVVAVEILAETAMSVIGTSRHSLHCSALVAFGAKRTLVGAGAEWIGSE
jgi:hypothetical protein